MYETGMNSRGGGERAVHYTGEVTRGFGGGCKICGRVTGK